MTVDGYTYTYEQHRCVPGDQWLRWSTAQQELARAGLRYKLREMVTANGLVPDRPIRESTGYDEQLRQVRLAAGMRVPGPEPVGRPL